MVFICNGHDDGFFARHGKSISQFIENGKNYIYIAPLVRHQVNIPITTTKTRIMAVKVRERVNGPGGGGFLSIITASGNPQKSFSNGRIILARTGRVRRVDMSDHLAETLGKLYTARKKKH